MSWISDIWDEIWEPAREGLGDMFANMYHIRLNVFNIDFDSENMTSTIKSITDWNNVKNFGSEGITMYDIGATINSFVVPIGLSLLVIFFYDTFNKANSRDRKSNLGKNSFMGMSILYIKNVNSKVL